MRSDAVKKPLVTCVMASYNKGQWLLESLWSLFNQTYHPVEVVVCDNGSTDDSRSILESFEGPDNYKLIYKDEAIGVARAFNLCLSVSSGEYVVMLAADDLLKPDHISLLMDAVAKYPEADVIYGDLEVIDKSGTLKAKCSAANGYESIRDKCSIGHTASITRKATYDEIGGYDELLKMSIDWDFLLRAIRDGKKFQYCGETGYQWRRILDSDQITMKYGMGSQERRESHSLIRRRYGLSGACQCGCGAVP
jgi:glycosyltransferase involved in cell wall biosynthesis